MNVFITGATGFLGYHIAVQCIKEGHQVLCLRRPTSKSLFSEDQERHVIWITNDEDDFEDKIMDFAPEVLIHAAWSGVRGADRDCTEVQNENIRISRQLFTLYPYKQIVSIGSQAEYGYYKNVVNEEYPLNPVMEYAKAKVSCSKILQHYCELKSIEWQWIRVFTVFGEKQTGGLIKIAIEKCLSEQESFPTTRGEQKYSYLYSADFAKAICKILGAKGKSGVYNLSQPMGLYSNRDVLERIKRLTKSNIRYEYGAIPYSECQVMLMDGCVDKFERTFGAIPYTDFDQALIKSIDSFRK